MTQNEEIKDVFARYAAEVGRYLSARGRDDIEREIAAALADRLDDRTLSGQTATLDDAVTLLKETGHPRKTAASYLTHGYIIGPALYPLFLLVCRLVLPVLAAVLIGALTLSAALAADTSVGFFIDALRILGTTTAGLLQTFAVLVILFTILDRVDAGKRAAVDLSSGANWDPRQLPKVKAIEVIKTSDQIAAIITNTVYIVFLLLVRDAGQMPGTLHLSLRLINLLPFLMGVAGIQILAAIFLLTRPAHTTAIASAQVLVKALGVIVGGLLLTTWPFVLAGGGMIAALDLAIRVLREIVRVGCYLGIVFGSIDVARTLLRFHRAALAPRA